MLRAHSQKFLLWKNFDLDIISGSVPPSPNPTYLISHVMHYLLWICSDLEIASDPVPPSRHSSQLFSNVMPYLLHYPHAVTAPLI